MSSHSNNHIPTIAVPWHTSLYSTFFSPPPILPLTPPTASSTTKLARPFNSLIPPARPIAAINKAQPSKHEFLTQSTPSLQATLQSPHKTLDIDISTPHRSLSILTVPQRLLPRPNEEGGWFCEAGLTRPISGLWHSGTIPHNIHNKKSRQCLKHEAHAGLTPRVGDTGRDRAAPTCA